MIQSASHIIFKISSHRSVFLLFFALILLVGRSPAQVTANRAVLEEEKAKIQKRLREFDTVLKKTTDEKRISLGELRAVNQKLEARESYIATLNRELRLVKQEIQQTSSRIVQLEEELNNLKEEYGKMIYTSYKLNQGVNLAAFIFTSATFKQFYMRLKYLKQYSDARKKQVVQMGKVSQDLTQKQAELEAQRSDQLAVLAQEEEQRKELNELKTEQQQLVSSLSQKEEALKKEIAATRKQQEELNQLIKRVIEEEMRLSRARDERENKATEEQPAEKSLPAAPKAAALSTSFASNRGKIPWPVESGFISRKYGTYPHPTLKGITETNDGVDIQTNNNAPVKAVFAGKVTKITTVPGMGGTIIIKHGDFYTMYSRLKTISVTSGQDVTTSTVLGTVYTDADGISELHFQTWKGLEVMDPSIWLSSK